MSGSPRVVFCLNEESIATNASILSVQYATNKKSQYTIYEIANITRIALARSKVIDGHNCDREKDRE